MNVVEAPVDIGCLITRTLGIKNGSPHIAGTGVLVRTLVRMYQQGLLAEEIAAEYGHLTLAQVHAALAYYHANHAAVEDDIAQQDAEADRLASSSLNRPGIRLASKCGASSGS